MNIQHWNIETGEITTLSLKDAIKHTLSKEPASTAMYNLIIWRAGAMDDEDIALLDYWIDKATQRAKELGIEL